MIKKTSPESAILRQKAEELLDKKSSKSGSPPSWQKRLKSLLPKNMWRFMTLRGWNG